MGQYYKIVNLDKKQYLHPHKFGNGLKLLEFGRSANGTMTGLAILLASSRGDLCSENPIVGSWAGDRIVIAGDYADKGRHLGNRDRGRGNVWDVSENWEDISTKVLRAMADDEWLRNDLMISAKDSYEGSPLRQALAEAGIDQS